MWINKIANKMASKIGKELSLSNEKQEIIEYGAISLLSQLLGIILILIAASILNIVRESIVVTLCSMLLRKYSGGAHCSSPIRCGLLSTIVVPLLVYLGKYIYTFQAPIYIIIVVSLEILSIIIFYLYAPKDSPSKPIKNKDKIKKFKIKSVYLSFFILLISISLFYFNLGQISILAALGVFNQAFSLTKLGYIFIESFDKLLKIIL